MKLAYQYIDLAEAGIHYFQTYYQNLLLVAVSVAMIGWMFSLYQQLYIYDTTASQLQQYSTKSIINILGLIALTVLFAYGILIEQIDQQMSTGVRG